MKFSYSGFDSAGKKINGVVESATGDDARESLRRQGLFVTTLAAAGVMENRRRGGSKKIGTSRRLRSISTFARQLHLLLGGGTPLIQALSAAERQSSHPGWKAYWPVSVPGWPKECRSRKRCVPIQNILTQFVRALRRPANPAAPWPPCWSGSPCWLAANCTCATP